MVLQNCLRALKNVLKVNNDIIYLVCFVLLIIEQGHCHNFCTWAWLLGDTVG